MKLGTADSLKGSPTRLVRQALDSGVTFFDTADAYGAGTSERVLGAALRSERSQVIIATKGGYLFRERSRIERGARRVLGPVITRVRARGSADRQVGQGAASRASSYSQQDFSAAYLRAAINGSLRRLRTDYIDIYQLHGPKSLCSDETVELMDELLRSGTVRRFGVGLEQLDNAEAWVRVRTLSSVQLPFGLLDPGARAVFPAVDRAGARLICRGVFGSGLLDAGPPADPSDPNHGKLEVVQAVRRLAGEAGVTTHQLAVWWVLAEPRVETMLVGINSSDHLTSTVRYVTTPCLDEDVLKRLDEVISANEPGGSIS